MSGVAKVSRLRIRDTVNHLRSSQIREVANSAMGETGVVPFWFGEPDEPTASAICQAAIDSLLLRETKYVQTLGIPALREEVASYVSKLHGARTSQNIAITASGTAALSSVITGIVDYKDRVVAVTPVWPSLVEMPKILGAEVTTVSLQFRTQGWSLDVDQLLAELTPGTKAVLINSPNNPTGWVMSKEEQQRVLEHCRSHGIWIIADDVYERYYFDGPISPSFLDICADDDLVVSCNSFSKTWSMTGWRLGWIVAPAEVINQLSKLIEFSTACSPVFVQKAALYALNNGDALIRDTACRLKSSRDHLVSRLTTIPGVRVGAVPKGAMYVFFQIDGLTDSLGYCKRLIQDAKLGLAPGIAFGPEGEGFLRWCYAASPSSLDDGINRLSEYLRSN
ncbi:pyridoxal phosphate-dependent aminotransferase [Agrobacterium sp. NPDC089420]|uniref:pyridoxal phosphate-dependent aminotransferase n=1 Tax=Agrobacterium sp. NPDC089420 TaxID=3363918 RepID=UPI00384E1A54